MDWEDVVLETWRKGQAISAVGPGPVDVHLEHARHWVDRLDPGARHAVDLGSGAGIPGLALAGLTPECSWVLVDAAARRTRLLEEAVRLAGWQDRVRVVHERAELLPAAGVVDLDIVVARLFAGPAVTAECAAPLLRRGGQLLVSEPVDRDGRWDPAGLATLGLAVGTSWRDPAMQELRRVGDPEPRFPRRPGIAAKRPLW